MKLRTILFNGMAFFMLIGITTNSYCADGNLRNFLTTAKPTEIVSGLKFSEGPVWIPGRGLIFSDIPANTQYLWNEQEGLTVFRKPSGYANGNALTKDNFLISAQHDRSLCKVPLSAVGKTKVLATHYEGRRLNSPNDVVVASNGDIYFTDPVYGIIGYGPKKAQSEQPVRGIYRINSDGTALSRVAGELEMPNGLAFSSDGKLLYVSNSADGNIYEYSVTSDGSLKNVRIFAIQPVSEGKSPSADGIKVDADGNIWACSTGGVSVYSPDGEYLAHLPLSGHVSNVAFGGPTGHTLFITSSDKVYRLLIPDFKRN